MRVSRKDTRKDLLASNRSIDSSVRLPPPPKHSLLHRILNRGDTYNIQGAQSLSFHRQTYDLPIQALDHLSQETLGFTNQPLFLASKPFQRIFVPAYSSLKIKSFQEIDIKDRIASVNCVLIVSFMVEGLEEALIQQLKQRIMVQINRGEGFMLREDLDSTKIRMKQGKSFIKFIVRDIFPVQIYEDIFLSPFEILTLAMTVTLNSFLLPEDVMPKTIVSFNNMRNPERVCISYSLECKLGVYDLAERRLEAYPSNYQTFDEVRTAFNRYAEGKEQEGVAESIGQLIEPSKQASYNIQPPASRQRRPLQMAKHQKSAQRKDIKYFEYSHFVIPVYKIPGSSWATIFIPIFMLALLSISVFFQGDNLESKIGSVATFVLAFIAFIPSIKDQLPNSKRITLSEIIVYAQALNCMLSLVDNLILKQPKRVNVWKNKVFLLSLTVHLICIGLAIGLLLLHWLFWERKYNLPVKAREIDPKTDRDGWNNPYCDEVFLKYNADPKNQAKVVKYQGKEQSSHFEGVSLI